MKKAVWSLLISAVVLMAAAPGIRPRADANSYPVHQEQSDFSIGAVLLAPEQVKKMFKPDLNHAGYVVIEVGVFPAPGKDVDLYPTDFTLSAGDKSAALRPISADTIAEIWLAGRSRRAYADLSTSILPPAFMWATHPIRIPLRDAKLWHRHGNRSRGRHWRSSTSTVPRL